MCDHVGDRETLLAALDDVISSGGVGELIVGEKHLAPPRGATFQSWCRIGFTISGSTGVRFVQDGKVVGVSQEPGIGMFFPPYAWNMYVPPTRGQFFSVVFRETCARFVQSDKDAERTPSRVSHCQHHTSSPLSSPGREVLSALRQVTESPRGLTTGLLLCNALLRLCRDELAGDDGSNHADKAARTYERACSFLQENYHEPINREEAARALRLHPNYLSRLFKDQGGRTFSSYLRDLRMDHAKRLLRLGALQIDEIAARSGFGDLGHFHRTFKKLHGESPGAYRRQRKNMTSGS